MTPEPRTPTELARRTTETRVRLGRELETLRAAPARLKRRMRRVGGEIALGLGLMLVFVVSVVASRSRRG